MRVTILCQEYPVPGAEFVFVHAADVATMLSGRGNDVTVLTTSRGAVASRPAVAEPISPVNVRRLPLTWFGKRSYALRIFAAISFFVQVGVATLLGRRPDVLVVSTAPPMIGPVAAVFAAVRRVPVVFWAMDLNPEQLAAIGRLSEASLAYRLLDGMMRWFVARCRGVIALDEAMRDRLIQKGAAPRRISIVPPWADDRHVASPRASSLPRSTVRDQRLGKLLLYSGNLSPSNPIADLIAAFERTSAEHDMQLVFRGTGGLMADVRSASARLPGRVELRPPVAAERLAEELAAAGVHVATMGCGLTGILHPSKVYTAMSAGRPVLFIGPPDSPSARLIRDKALGWAVAHDVAEIAAVLMQVAAMPNDALEALSRHCAEVSRASFSQAALCQHVVECIERAGTEPGFR